MYIFRIIFNLCLDIMKIRVYLLGFSVSLFNVFVFTFVASILLYVLFSLFD